MIGFEALGVICALALAPAPTFFTEAYYGDVILSDQDADPQVTPYIYPTSEPFSFDGQDNQSGLSDDFDGTVSGNGFTGSTTPLDEFGGDTYDLFAFFRSLIDDGIIPLSSYDTYYGGIGTTYLEYMRGFLPKLGFDDHYVASRVSQYQYIFAYGSDLSFDGALFTGTDIMVITWYTNNNGIYTSGFQSVFSLDPSNYMVYTDLTNIYPSLADSGDFSLRQIVLFLGILVTFYTVGLFIKGFTVKRRSRRW